MGKKAEAGLMKNVLVVGAGISGLGAAHVLLRHGYQVLISDLHDNIKDLKEKQTLLALGAIFKFGAQAEILLKNIDTVVVSPVVPLENPIVAAALKKGIPVISEVELAYRMTKAPILAVTGTNGKTTTTTLLGDMINDSGIPFALAGNMGISLSREAELVPKNGLIAAEISSFQLEFIDTFRPKAAVILNITPDHMERHHTMENYVETKARIFENMGEDQCILLNAEDSYTPYLTKKAHAEVCLFSTKKTVKEGASLLDDTLVLKRHGQEIVLAKIQDIQLKGNQNYENILAASFLAYEGGIPVESIRHSILSFKGLPHRIEFVGTFNGISYYNDSKATNVDAAIKGMEAFNKPVILIAGGHDKGTPLNSFMEAAKKHVKHLILIGEAASRFKVEAEKSHITSVVLASDMEDAVKKGKELAGEGDTVLLSPACSSFDMYSSFEERGLHFKRIVNKLNG